jgi:predicted Ser/Thr protein kinase
MRSRSPKKKTKTPPPVKKLRPTLLIEEEASNPIFQTHPQRVLPYLDHPEASILVLDSCLQGITVKQYLAKGLFGAVYLVDYEGQERVMKIVVDEVIKDWLSSSAQQAQRFQLRKTSNQSFEKEVERLEQASQLGIGPHFYYATQCKVQLPYFLGNQIFQMGVIILERLHQTLGIRII